MRRLEDVNWEDLRVFSALAASRSFRDAAARLDLTHPTVRRRLDSLEAALGLKLFHRHRAGLDLTVEGAELVGAGLGVENAVLAMVRRAELLDSELKGPIRVTVTQTLARVLAPALAAFQNAWPQIELRLDSTAALVDLARFEADVAIRGYRLGRRPPEHLVGRRAVSGCRAIYGDALATPWWIAAEEHPSRTGWTATSDFADLPIRAVIPDTIVRHAGCLAGMGLATLPCGVGDPDLPRLTAPAPDFDVWVLVHPDLRNNPRLRVFRDAIVDALLPLEGLLLGA